MKRVTLNVEDRKEAGKGAARSLRRNEMIPAVLYRAGDSRPIKVRKKEFTQFINTTAGEQVMINLQFDNGENKLALMKDYQIEPTKRELLHADFFEVSLTEEVNVNVYVTTIGEPVGVKRDGGILQHLLREIEIECLPDKIPGHIQIDISGLEIGQAIYVSDLTLEEGVHILTDPEEVVFNVLAPIVEEVTPTEEAVAPEITEPELVKKGKKEEEVEGKEEESK